MRQLITHSGSLEEITMFSNDILRMHDIGCKVLDLKLQEIKNEVCLSMIIESHDNVRVFSGELEWNTDDEVVWTAEVYPELDLQFNSETFVYTINGYLDGREVVKEVMSDVMKEIIDDRTSCKLKGEEPNMLLMQEDIMDFVRLVTVEIFKMLNIVVPEGCLMNLALEAGEIDG